MFIFAPIFLFVGLASLSGASTYKFLEDKGSVEFKAKGKPALISIRGKGEGLKGSLSEAEGKISGTVEFQLDKLKTGIALRDDHMKEKYLEVKKYPTAVLKIDSLSVPKNGEKFAFTGTLKLHGQSREVKGEGKLTGKAESLHLEAELPIKLSEFAVAIPSFQGITVAEDVTIVIDTPVVRN